MKARDQLLILLAGGIAAVAMVCATVIVCVAHAPVSVGIGVLTGCVGLAGVALGRLSAGPKVVE